MTSASLSRDIALARAEFNRLNAGRSLRGSYRQRNPDTERLLVLLAERIARLYSFRSHLAARDYAAGANQKLIH